MSNNSCIMRKRLLNRLALTLEPEFADQHNNTPVLGGIVTGNMLKNTFKEKYQVHISMQPEHQCSTGSGNLTGKIRFRVLYSQTLPRALQKVSIFTLFQYYCIKDEVLHNTAQINATV